MKNNLPNFLIVGAGKSGTTSLYYYLKQHPAIYMSPLKEPHYLICDSLVKPHLSSGAHKYNTPIVKDFEEYKDIFSGAKDESQIGEASTGYLYYYKDAIPQIKRVLGNIKIIIILRNPIDRAYSHYLHHIRDGSEQLSFEEALQVENERKKSNWAWTFFYKEVGMYYEQVKAYLSNFENVKIFLFDELNKDAPTLVKNIYSFLEVDNSFTPNLKTHYNVSGLNRYKVVHNLIAKPNLLKSVVKQMVSKAKREQIKRYFLKKPTMKTDTKKYLIEVFREDILALLNLIDRDLLHWLK